MAAGQLKQHNYIPYAAIVHSKYALFLGYQKQLDLEGGEEAEIHKT